MQGRFNKRIDMGEWGSMSCVIKSPLILSRGDFGN